MSYPSYHIYFSIFRATFWRNNKLAHCCHEIMFSKFSDLNPLPLNHAENSPSHTLYTGWGDLTVPVILYIQDGATSQSRSYFIYRMGRPHSPGHTLYTGWGELTPPHTARTTRATLVLIFGNKMVGKHF